MSTTEASLFALIDGFLLPGALAVMMFGIGLNLQVRDFRRVLSSRTAFVRGMVSMLLLVPAAGIALALALGPTPELTLGLVLLATCPGGLLSNAMTDFADGDVALSVCLSTGSSLAYMISLPLVLAALTVGELVPGIAVPVPYAASLSAIILFTALPIAMGMIGRRTLPNLARAAREEIRRYASFALVVMLAIVIYRERDALLVEMGPLLATIFAMNLVNVLIATVMSIGPRLNAQDRIAIVMEHLIRQEGTAIFVAVSVIGLPAAAIPMILNTLVGMLASLLFVGLIRIRKYGARSSDMAVRTSLGQ